MKNYTLLFLILFAPLALSGQKYISQTHFDSMYSLSAAALKTEDLLRYENVPKLKLSEAERQVPLPPAVNNAETPYMIPIFYQAALECGQASTICYTLTYELLRRRHQDYMWGFDFQYPSHFAWNFCNQGYNQGVSFMETWEVIRTAGTPNVTEWGGWYSYGGPKRWLSGYNLYHSAMKNRISEVYAIPLDDEDGILTLKHWLSDHLNGEATGGLANFYCTYFGTIHDVLPEGTPEAGKKILTSFSSLVNHTQAIVGYNDSIRWDYNGDGLYTNDIDINGDGVVNVKDWELGGVIFCNTFGTNFADNGYCYVPYQKLACLPEEGGIWNKCVYVPFVKDEVYPQVTFKATICYTSRHKLKLTAGIATDTNATTAEHTMEFMVFNYQGGDQYMQGDIVPEANKTLELGLDISPLLNYARPDTACKFFFLVTEDDPHSEDAGTIVNFALMDYTSGSEIEQPYPTQNVPILNNTTTTLAITRAIHFTKPEIEDSVLTMEAYTPFQHQLSATGGKPPYRWEFTKEYDIDEFSAPYPTTSGNIITLSDAGNGYAAVPLHFDFPFYEDTYNQVYVYANGYITFHHNTYNWPFMLLEDVQNITTRMICPFKADLTQCSVQSVNEDDCMTFIYNAKMYGQNNSAIRFTVKLYKNGTIEFYYGSMNFSGTDYWSAILRGDAQTIQHSSVSGIPASQISGRRFRFTPKPRPSALELSPTGLLSGTSTNAFHPEPFSVTCYDNNDVATTKTLNVSSHYTSLLLIKDIQINGEENPTIYGGDTLTFTVTIQNADTLPYRDGQLLVMTEDPYIQLLDSSEYFGYIGPGNEYTLNRCITCVISPTTPNRHIVNFTFLLDNDIAPTYSIHSYRIYANDFQVTGYEICDIANNNHLLEAEELDTVTFFMLNEGGRTAYNVDFVLRVDDPDVIVVSGLLHKDTLRGNENFVFPTLLVALATFTNGHTFDAYIDVYIGGHIQNTLIVSIIGHEECLKFENGIVPPTLTDVTGQTPWTIDDECSNSCGYSLRSGVISHNDTSSVNYLVTLNYAGTFSFDYKISTETRYDHLCFYVDGVLKNLWSGIQDWTNYSCHLDAGTHLLTWKYGKDYSVDAYSDCVWIDNICLPTYYAEQPELAELPEDMEITLGMHNHKTLDTTVTLTNVANIYTLFENDIVADNQNLVGWVSVTPSNGCINALEQKDITLHFSSYDYVEDDYYAALKITLSNDSVYRLPLILHVMDDTGVQTYQQDGKLKIYPNPTSGIVHIFHEEATIEQLQLFDIYGKLLYHQNVHDGHASIDLSSYSHGVYVLQVETSDGIAAHKIMKQ